MIYDRMTHDHGYSVRKLAQKLGKDKGYIENRLRLAGAPTEIKQLVSLRKDTLSHAYELLKVEDPRKRRKLAEQVARGELSLVKLRERIEGRPHVERDPGAEPATAEDGPSDDDRRFEDSLRHEPVVPVGGEDALVNAKAHFAEALEELQFAVRSQEALSSMSTTDRQNLAKYFTIAKLKLENAIA